MGLRQFKCWIIQFLLRTIGKLSDGIHLGWRTGFYSGVILEYNYENKPRGITPLGILFDKLYLLNPVWDGVRSRRRLLVE